MMSRARVVACHFAKTSISYKEKILTSAASASTINSHRTFFHQSSPLLQNKNVNIHEKISSTKSLKDILEFSQYKEQLEIQDVTQIIEKIGHLHKEQAETVSIEDIENLLEDERFQNIEQVLYDRITLLKLPDLLQTLSYLLKLTSKDLQVTKSLEARALMLMRKVSIGSVCRILEMHKNHLETDLRKDVYENALKTVERRWVELTHPRDILLLLFMSVENNPKFFGKLLDKTLEQIEEFRTKDMYKVFNLLSRAGVRHGPVIRALAYHLNKQLYELHPNQVNNLVSLCVSLKCFNTDLLDGISSYILTSESPISDVSVAVSLLRSFSGLRYRNAEIVDMLTKVVINNLETASPHDLYFVLMTFGNLDYLPKEVEEHLGSIVEKLQSSKESNRKQWLDVVWSLTVLNKAGKEHLKSVLTDDFYKSLTGSQENQGPLLRLLNIDTAAHCDVSDYDGPRLPDSFISDHKVQVPLRSNSPLTKSVLGALVNMAPAEKYFLLDTTTQGHVIDIEMLVNASGKPEPIREYNTDGSSDRAKPIPQDFHRIAMRVLDFGDMTTKDIKPTGLHSMAARHLSCSGYTVVNIPYYEFMKQKTTVKRVAYLDQKIYNNLLNYDKRF